MNSNYQLSDPYFTVFFPFDMQLFEANCLLFFDVLLDVGEYLESLDELLQILGKEEKDNGSKACCVQYFRTSLKTYLGDFHSFYSKNLSIEMQIFEEIFQ